MYRRFFDLDPGPIVLTVGLQPASPERINSIEIPRSRSNSASDGIFSRDSYASVEALVVCNIDIGIKADAP
jgi:hypothetical protein